MRGKRHKSARLKGFSFAEVAVTSSLIVILAVLAANVSLLIFACSVNDKACRDVVRAAAQQPSASQALVFAQASVKNHATDGFFIGPVQLVNGVTYQDYGGNPPNGMCPYVQCITSVVVTLPAPLYFYGVGLTNQFTFKQMYTSPIIKTKYILN